MLYLYPKAAYALAKALLLSYLLLRIVLHETSFNFPDEVIKKPGYLDRIGDGGGLPFTVRLVADTTFVNVYPHFKKNVRPKLEFINFKMLMKIQHPDRNKKVFHQTTHLRHEYIFFLILNIKCAIHDPS